MVAHLLLTVAFSGSLIPERLQARTHLPIQLPQFED